MTYVPGWRIIGAIAWLCVSAPAYAKGITYDCDTAANHYSELNLPAGDGAFTVSGNVRLNALAASTSYVPTARVQIASATLPGELPKAFAGFSLAALPADGTKTPSGASAVQMLSYNVNGQDDMPLPMSLLTKPGTVQPFDLSYDGHTVVVHLGAQSRSFPMTVAEPVVRLGCSTGEFLFTDLTIAPAG